MTDADLERIDKLVAKQASKHLTAVTAYNDVVPELLAEVRALRAALRDAVLHRHKTTKKVIDCDPAAGSTYEVGWRPEVEKWAALCGLDLSKCDPCYYGGMD